MSASPDTPWGGPGDPPAAVMGLDPEALFGPLFGRYNAIALAVSGGSDSMALMLLAREWARARDGAPRLHVLTVDHGLRAGSREDAETVRRVATRLDLACDILTWEPPRPLTGLQAAARAARYRLLVERARALDLDALATAHTLDDQGETILMRLARGSGLKGLSGMAATTSRLGLPLLRPLLGLDRASLRAAIEARGVGHVDDPSNADPRFERVRWRALMPAFAAQGLDSRALSRFAARCRRADEALESLASALLAGARARADGRVVLSRAVFRGAPLDLQIRVLAGLIARVVDAPADANLAAPRLIARDEKLERLAVAIARDTAVRRTLGGAEVVARAETVTVRRENPRRTSNRTHPAVAPLPYGVTRDDRTDLSGAREPPRVSLTNRFTTASDGANEGLIDPSQAPVPDLH